MRINNNIKIRIICILQHDQQSKKQSMHKKSVKGSQQSEFLLL